MWTSILWTCILFLCEQMIRYWYKTRSSLQMFKVKTVTMYDKFCTRAPSSADNMPCSYKNEGSCASFEKKPSAFLRNDFQKKPVSSWSCRACMWSLMIWKIFFSSCKFLLSKRFCTYQNWTIMKRTSSQFWWLKTLVISVRISQTSTVQLL